MPDLTREQWEERNVTMIEKYGTGMSDGSYDAYIERITANRAKVDREKAELERHNRLFFQAEALNVPHHGSTSEN